MREKRMKQNDNDIVSVTVNFMLKIHPSSR